jgi:hypothetical protein
VFSLGPAYKDFVASQSVQLLCSALAVLVINSQEFGTISKRTSSRLNRKPQNNIAATPQLAQCGQATAFKHHFTRFSRDCWLGDDSLRSHLDLALSQALRRIALKRLSF